MLGKLTRLWNMVVTKDARSGKVVLRDPGAVPAVLGEIQVKIAARWLL